MHDGHTADVTVHVDETLAPAQQSNLSNGLQQLDGVVSIHMGEGPAAHLVVIGYDPEIAHAEDLLYEVEHQGLHGELIGF